MQDGGTLHLAILDQLQPPLPRYKWDAFLSLMQPLASTVPLMVAGGNHEMDAPQLPGNVVSGSRDSGGECGVPYARYFGLHQPHGDTRGFYGSWDHGP